MHYFIFLCIILFPLIGLSKEPTKIGAYLRVKN